MILFMQACESTKPQPPLVITNNVLVPLDVPVVNLPERTPVKAWVDDLHLATPNTVSELLQKYSKDGEAFAYLCADEQYFLSFAHWLESAVTRKKQDEEAIRYLLGVIEELREQSDAIRVKQNE